jgi:hypothetical protein
MVVFFDDDRGDDGPKKPDSDNDPPGRDSPVYKHDERSQRDTPSDRRRKPLEESEKQRKDRGDRKEGRKNR